MIYKSITEHIGNTPLLLIDPAVHGLENINVYAKLELFNPFGSVKDRISWGILKDEVENLVKEKRTIIESSSGNTAKAMQGIAGMYGIPFKTVTNRIKIPEVKQILQLMGTSIEELPGLSECPDPNDPNDPISYIETMMSKSAKEFFHTAQYTNEKNPQTHYETTGKEIWDDLGSVDYFIGGLGTAGSTMGTATYLREKNPLLQLIGVIAKKGELLPGIRNIDEMFEVGIFKKEEYQAIVPVSSQEAIDAMLLLIRSCGVLAGPTSGASMQGALNYLKEVDSTLQEKKNAVFIVCDRVEWYLSYIQKRRPELFAEEKKDGIRTLTDDEITSAPVKKQAEVLGWIEEKKPVIIDIRGNLAYRIGHIPSSLNIIDSELETMLESGIPFPENAEVLLVCPIGELSKKYTAFLVKKGVKAFSLEGGIVGWRDASMPLERSTYLK